MNEDIKKGTILQSYNADVDVNADIRDITSTIKADEKLEREDDLHFAPVNSNKILIKYHTDIDKIQWKEGSDWIDLRAAETIQLKAGEFKIISLGVSIRFSDEYEAHIAPRSSTFKNFKIIQTNSVGVIDSSYNTDKDIWGMPVLAIEDTIIHKNDRICQFRLIKKMKPVTFVEVDELKGTPRRGFGSSGIQ